MHDILFDVTMGQIKKVLRDSYFEDRIDVLDRLFSSHGEDWDSSSLEQCLAGVYTKSGAKTPQEFQDYIELQLTFL